MSSDEMVYLLDDEPEILKALKRLLRAHGFQVRAFSSVRDFFSHDRSAEPACLVLDVAMPELDGLEVQQQLARHGDKLPIVFLTGHGDIPISVRAIKAGAENFLTKPVDAAALIPAVRAALQRAEEEKARRIETSAFEDRLRQLTPRQREVFEYVIAGKMNKQIAAKLGTGEQTVNVHRRRVMRKMGVTSVAELVRQAERLGIMPAQ